jgi:TonB family protein
MHRLDRNIQIGPFAAYLAVVLLSSHMAARSQDGSPTTSPIDLNSKVVSKLVLRNEKPKYPSLARFNYIQGQVRIQLLVSAEGKVTDAHVLNGHPFLAASALSVVRRWSYRPYRTKLGAVPFSTLVDFVFELHDITPSKFPPKAEKDLQSRVTPPEVVNGPAEESANHVRFRVLVDSEGHVIDTHTLSGSAADIERAQESMSNWTFRPARWGALAVPWYLEIDVPVQPWPAKSAATDPSGMENRHLL